MLNAKKQRELLECLKKYSKTYLHGKLTELDESGTRLMVNSFLTDVLGYTPIEEIKTEYMIRGTYADYVIQTKGTRHFLIEVKSLSLSLSEKHLRQAINYGANEGIEWAMLTNGRSFDFYRILFNKPIESVKVFSFDFSNATEIKNSIEILQFLHKDSVGNKGLQLLWNKHNALSAVSVAGMLYAPTVINYLKKGLKEKYKHSFTEDEVKNAIDNLICEPVNMENVKPVVFKKKVKAKVIEVKPGQVSAG